MPDPTTNKPASVQLYALTTDGARVPVRAGADGKLVLGADVDIDTTGLATSAKQDTLLAALAQPTTFTVITPNDSTDVTATCSKGLIVTATGLVNVTGVGGSAVSLGVWPAGSYIPGALSRVNAATLATVIGLS